MKIRSTSSSNSSSEAESKQPVQQRAMEKLDNDNDNLSVTVNVAAMGNFAAGAEEAWLKEAPLEEIVKSLIVNPKNEHGEKIKNVFVVDDVAVDKFCRLRKIDRDSDIDFTAALQDERARRYKDLEATLPPPPPPTPSVGPATNSHPATSSWMSQRLAGVHDALVAHKRAFAVVASLATGAVMATAAAYTYLATIDASSGPSIADNRLYESRVANYSRGREIRNFTGTKEGYETREDLERHMRWLAEFAWDYPDERAFEPRKTPLDFDVAREFASDGPKTSGTTTLWRFNVTGPEPVVTAPQYDGPAWHPPTFIGAAAAITLASMLIIYHVIMRKLN